MLDLISQSFPSVLSDLTVAVVLGIAGLITGLYRRQKRILNRISELERELDMSTDGKTRLERHEDRMDEIQNVQERLERYFVGDPDDPADKGLLEEIYEIGETVDDVKENQEE